MSKRDEIIDKCVAFSVRINKLRKYLMEKHHEFNNSDQIQRCGTSIGANYSEACCAESKSDFVHKLSIAHKEAKETQYWLRVLYGSEFINKEMFDSLMMDLDELQRIITASIKTVKAQLKNSNNNQQSSICNHQYAIINKCNSILFASVSRGRRE